MPTLDVTHARERFASARVARLATVSAGGDPHVVPIVFAVVGQRIVSAVDHKPKTSRDLRRLSNITAHPRVSLLVDEYDDDWSQLWWARADGVASVRADLADDSGLAEALQKRYDQYAAQPPAGPFIVVDVTRWSGWSAR